MANETNHTTLTVVLVLLVCLIYSCGGVPFLGALVQFDEGGELRFVDEYTQVSKEIDPSTGTNLTETIPATYDMHREFFMVSKYVRNANMRLLGTPGITNSYGKIYWDKVEEVDGEPMTVTIERTFWEQPSNFADIVDVDMTEYLQGHEEGDSIRLTFHSDTAGSLVITEFDVDWGPTNAQIANCEQTGGTFNENALVCDCPVDSNGFTWENGCAFPEEVEDEIISSGGSTSSTTNTATTPAIQLQAIGPSVEYWKIALIVVVLGVFLFFKYEKGPKGFSKRI